MSSILSIVGDLMFAFGDVSNPDLSSLELLEDFVLELIENLLAKSYKRALRKDPNTNKIAKEDLLYFLQDDTRKFMRISKILHMEQWSDYFMKTTRENYKPKFDSDEDSS